MNRPIQIASHIYEQAGGNFAESLKEHLGVGCVINTPWAFLMGFFSRHERPTEPVPYDECDCVFVTLHAGDMEHALAQLRDICKFISFERGFRGDNRVRVYNMDKFNKAIKWVV